jgi:long-chain acyl-CoA synthetase
MALTSLANVLAESARMFPEKTAVVWGDQRISYADLWESARRYAGVLSERGIGPGKRVALLLPNVPDFPISYYAVLALGATAVPVHALLVAEEIAYVLNDSDASMLICAGPLLGEGAKGAELAGREIMTVLEGAADSGLPKLDSLAATATPIDRALPVQETDEAVVLYTSGTTGQPKGARLTHSNLIWNCTVAAYDTLKIGRDDILLGCLPLFHIFGQTSAMNAAFRVGASLVLMTRFDGAAAIDLMVKENVTIFQGVPTMYVGLLAAAQNTSARPALRSAISGGASLPVAVIDKVQETFGIEVWEGYGLSETSPVLTFNQAVFGRKAGSVGCAIWGIDVGIAKAEVEGAIELLPDGELGEIVARGHAIFAGYLNRPEETAAVVVDGWFRTGDLGYLDEDRFLFIVDRKKDLIIRGGYNVYPREVEEVLARHPGVVQVAVIGAPDDHYGEEVVAMVVLAEGADHTPAALRDYAKEHLGKHKYPRHVVLTDSFPLGPSGKVLKREIVRLLGEGEYGPLVD